MDEQDSRCARLAVRATALAGGRELHDVLTPLSSTAMVPTIIGLHEDTLASSLRKTEKLGGHAHLIVLEELPGRVRGNVLSIDFEYKMPNERDDELDRPVPPDLDLGTLIRDAMPGEEFAFNSLGFGIKVFFLASVVLPPQT